MLTLNDGRSELWQWDTGRTLAVDADCTQVHFSNKVFGRSIDVDVVDGAAIIPDVLLQADNDLNVWAFVGTAENGYTKISKTFKVNRRNKPADYVFTPTDQITLQTIQRQIGDLADLTTEAKGTLVAAINEAARTGGGGGGSTVELDTTLTQSGKAADAAAVGDRLSALSEEKVNLPKDDTGATQNGTSGQILQTNGDGTTQWVDKPAGSGTGSGGSSGLTTAQVNALDGMFKVAAYIKADVSAEYSAFKTAFGIDDTEPEKTLTSISATYDGGDVAVGTAVTDLTGIVVTAHYSDGSTETVTGYTLSGTIAEGSNTITVSYGGMTTTFAVTGVAESSGNPFDSTTWEEGVRYSGTKLYTGHAYYETCDYVDLSEYTSVTITNDTWGNTMYNVVWFDAEKTATSNEQGYIAKESTKYPNSVTASRPDGAVYCRITLSKNGNGIDISQWGHEFCVISVA